MKCRACGRKLDPFAGSCPQCHASLAPVQLDLSREEKHVEASEKNFTTVLIIVGCMVGASILLPIITAVKASMTPQYASHTDTLLIFTIFVIFSTLLGGVPLVIISYLMYKYAQANFNSKNARVTELPIDPEEVIKSE